MIDREKIQALSQVQDEHCISFFLPTHRVAGIEKDQIHYRNMLSKVEKVLEDQGLNPPEIRKKLADAQAVLKRETFWRDLSDGLAVYIYQGKTEFHPLPLELETYVYHGRQLYLKPLLSMINDGSDFYCLALSRDEVRIFEGERFTLTEMVKNADFPESLAQILATYDGETTLQQHAGAQQSAVFHGQGGGKDVQNARLEEYLRQVDAGVLTMACDDDTKPLVLYTTPKLMGIYRQVNTYPNLLHDYISGNPEGENLYTIHEKAWLLLEDRFDALLAERLDAFDRYLAESQASFNLIEIGPAAFAGRVETLFLTENLSDEVWGKYDASRHQVEVHAERQADSRPLHNDIALAVWQQGGQVRLLNRADLPRPTANLNAIFRYALNPA